MANCQLNKKDLMIIQNLCKNSRISSKELANKIGISKQGLHKKIKKIESRFIKKYLTLIDHNVLGYNTIHIYLKIQGLNRKSYFEKLQKLQNYDKICWVTNFIGDYDLGVSIMFKSTAEINQILSKIYNLFNRSIKNKEIHLINKQYASALSFGQPKEVIIYENNNTKIDISDLDKKIINFIENNPRFEWKDISSKIGINHKTLRSHLQDLQSKKVIKGYSAILDYKSLGYEWNICILNLVPGSDLKEILTTLKNDKDIPFISTTIEDNIIFDYVSRDYNDLKDFLDKLLINYSKMIDNYKILNVSKLEKLESF